MSETLTHRDKSGARRSISKNRNALSTSNQNSPSIEGKRSYSRNGRNLSKNQDEQTSSDSKAQEQIGEKLSSQQNHGTSSTKRTHDKLAEPFGEMNELVLRNRSIKKADINSQKKGKKGKKGNCNKCCNKVKKYVKRMSKKVWIQGALIILGILIIIAALHYIIGFAKKNKTHLSSEEEPLFCMNNSDRVYKYEVSEEECLKDLKEKSICDYIKLHKCILCPQNAICQKGKMQCMNGTQRLGNTCVEQTENELIEYYKFFESLQSEFRNDQSKSFLNYGSDKGNSIKANLLKREFLLRKGQFAKEEIEQNMEKIADSSFLNLVHKFKDFNLNFKVSTVPQNESELNILDVKNLETLEIEYK